MDKEKGPRKKDKEKGPRRKGRGRRTKEVRGRKKEQERKTSGYGLSSASRNVSERGLITAEHAENAEKKREKWFETRGLIFDRKRPNFGDLEAPVSITLSAFSAISAVDILNSSLASG